MAGSSEVKESTWQLQDAKARLSELVRRAMDDGPQHVSVRGEPAVVVISEADYRGLTVNERSIVEYILEGEPWPDDLVDTINDRSAQTDRAVDF